MLLEELFDIQNGFASSNLQEISEERTNEYTLPYIRPSSSWFNVIAGYVNKTQIPDEHIFPPDTLFVSTDGEGSHSYAYVSPIEFVPNSNVCVLFPKCSMTIQEKIFYAMVITNNRYKFSYERKPKWKRLAKIILPSSAPDWVEQCAIPNYFLLFDGSLSRYINNEPLVPIAELFEVQYGTNLALNALELAEKKEEDDSINFVSRTSKNNGISAIVKIIKSVSPLPAGCLTVAVGGSVLETFVQDDPFYTGRDMYYLKPKQEMSMIDKLFYAFCIRANKYRYNYNRQANKTLREIKIPGMLPDWLNSKELNEKIKQVGTV
jgi:hypothetical protein